MTATPSIPDREAIETRVDELLSRVPSFIWDGERLPVPVQKIVENSFGLMVRLVEDMTDAPGFEGERSENVSGLLLTAEGEIWVNASEARQWRGRKRFTIGHELGHYVMHQDELSPRIFCRKVEEDPDGREVPKPDQAPARTPTEREADAFAAALLMPRHLVADRFEAIGPDVPTMMEAFGASEKAMRIRLKTLFGTSSANG